MAVNYKDYYAILGVPKTAAAKDIKSAYRKLARKWHPDANPDKAKEAEEKFKDIQEAYEVLGDPEKRSKYDVLGSDWQRAAQDAARQRPGAQRGPGPGAGGFGGATFGEGTDFSDFFNMFFQNIGRRPTGGPQPGASRARPQRGEDLETTLDLTLAEAYSGGTKSVALQIEDVCPKCGGSGTLNNRVCPECGGTGRVLQTKRFDVTIPKGVREGQRIRLAGQGAAGPHNGPRGDLYLIAHFPDDNKWERRGDDLYIDLPVSIYDLVLGGDVAVPTMTGEVSMTVPAGTPSNKFMRLGGKGMPKLKSDAHGDEYVRLIGTLPTDLSEKEKKLFRELAALRNGKK